MSALSETMQSPTAKTVPESPTTVKPFEMDDDDQQELGIVEDESSSQKALANSATAPAPSTVTGLALNENPPPKPPRPMTEGQKNEQMLKEAFPSIELVVIKAVLTASGGRVEPAFNALLEMTDPEAAERDRPPPPALSRPAEAPAGPTSTDLTQLEADELYARQLAEHYENLNAGDYEARAANRGLPRGRQEAGLTSNVSGHREHSFIEDDLPVIKENLRKGFLETQAKVNSWVTTLKRRLDEQFDEGDDHGQIAGSSSVHGRPMRDQTRRSADYERYDADPELLGDDFAGMKFHHDGTQAHNRPLANPSLFKPPPPATSPKASDGRKIAFDDNIEDMDTYGASPKLTPKDSATAPAAPHSGGKASKWQPLSTVDPNPISDSDPFSLGDSEDEKDSKTGNREIKMEDSERLRKAAANAMADSLIDGMAHVEAGSKKD